MYLTYCQGPLQALSKFACVPATAALFSSIGEVEVFSKEQKCNQRILEFSALGGEGRSIDLLDDQLVLLGDSKVGGHGGFEYKTIPHPRNGLLGMKFTTAVSPLGNLPRWHSSLVDGNLLLAVGGEFQTQAKFSSRTWANLNLQQNSSNFSRFAIGACKVKVEKDVFLLIGGLESGEKPRAEMNTVFKLNITSESVEELPQIKKRRAFHSCEVFQNKVLISGGAQGDKLVDDEIYNLATKKSEILKKTSSLQRQKHQLLRLEETIFSFGGVDANGLQIAAVKWFDWAVKRWKKHEQTLLSKNTSNLAVVALPMSAVDCYGDCSCGLGGSLDNSKIVGGSNAQVNKN